MFELSIGRVPACIGVGALFWVAGCSGSIRGLPVQPPTPDRCVVCPANACGSGVRIQFLGAAGFVIQRGDDVLVTGPFFSNPGFLRAGLGEIESDSSAVLRWMPNVPGADAVVVGHSHYDHLMDAVTVSRERAGNAPIYVNDTGAYILAAVREPPKVIALDRHAWSFGHPQDWIHVPGTQVRLLPILSEHAPHFHGVELYDGAYDVDQGKLPVRARGWKLGQPLAFLIEFLAPDGSVDLRIHYQDSASNPRAGFPPSDLPPARYKILLPCVASWHEVENYPEGILDEFDPNFAILGHWEDFFLPYSDDVGELRSVRLTDPGPFLDAVEAQLGSRFALPSRLATVRFQPECP